MSGFLNRDMLAQVVIVSAATAGCWMLFVQPKANALCDLEAEISLTSRESLAADRATVEQVASQVQTVRARVGQVRSRNVLASDTSRIYGLVDEVARAYGLSLRRFDPKANRPTQGAGTLRSFEAIEFNVTVEGPFARVTAFLGAVDRINPQIRLTDLILTPRRGDPSEGPVEAQFTYSALTFNISQTLLAHMEHTDVPD